MIHRHGPWHRRPYHARGRLHGRIFRWFGATILATCLVFMVVFHLFGDKNGWMRERNGALAFVRGQLAQSWDNPEGRSSLILALGRDLDLDLELRNDAGVVLERSGECPKADFSIEVPSRGVLAVCAGRHHFGATWRLVLALFVAAAVVWAASGRIARRLA